jgi:hypothetical protein
VVFVAVGEDDHLHVLGALDQPAPVGEHQVDPEHVLLGEHQPTVDQRDLAVVFDGGAVAPDLTEPAEEGDLNTHSC